jgi:hypothetical protein
MQPWSKTVEPFSMKQFVLVTGMIGHARIEVLSHLDLKQKIELL